MIGDLAPFHDVSTRSTVENFQRISLVSWWADFERQFESVHRC